MSRIKTNHLYHGECRNKFLIENSDHLCVQEIIMTDVLDRKDVCFPAVFNSIDDALDYLRCKEVEIDHFEYLNDNNNSVIVKTKDDGDLIIKSTGISFFDHGWIFVEMEE